MRKLLVVAIALILITAGWWYESPLWTLHEMRSAAEKGDSRQLSEYIDYPAVRESLEAQFRRQIFEEAAKSKQQGGFGAIGSAVGLTLMTPVVDALVSPEGLEAVFAHRNVIPVTRGRGLPQVPSKPLFQRNGLNEFIVSDKNPTKGSMVFERSGLGWKLVGFEFPPTLS